MLGSPLCEIVQGSSTMFVIYILWTRTVSAAFLISRLCIKWHRVLIRFDSNNQAPSWRDE